MGRRPKYSSDEERREVAARKAREKYARGKESIRSYKIDKDAEAYRGTKAYRLYHGTKTRAKKYNLPFDLDIKYIHDLLENSKVCPLLDVEFDDGKYTQSIDKKIPELGYVKSNIWVISLRANTIKNDSTIDELELISRNLREKMNAG